MIRYHLICEDDHEFESWFKDSQTFDHLEQAACLECPICGSTKVQKAIMAPRVLGTAKATDDPEVRARQVAMNILSEMGALREKVEKEFDDVGDEFADEARRMHYGEVEKRGIYGEASVADAVDLAEEGIEVMPLPKKKKKRSDA